MIAIQANMHQNYHPSMGYQNMNMN